MKKFECPDCKKQISTVNRVVTIIGHCDVDKEGNVTNGVRDDEDSAYLCPECSEDISESVRICLQDDDESCQL